MTQTITEDRGLDDEFDQQKDAVIMMVDDEPILMEIIQTFLEEEGYQHFITIDDSTKALATIDQERPDVLLLDLMMPEVDGFTILESIRRDAWNKYLPVIVLTSSTDSETKLRALEMGATDFLAKPVDSSELALRLRNTLMVKAYQDQLTYYDTLTNLPNRKLFLDRVDWAIQRSHRAEKPMAVMVVGLDRFKQVNETFGPRAGDEILTQAAARLKFAVRQDDVVTVAQRWQSVARLGGDEFAVLLPEISQAEIAGSVARRMLDALKEPLSVEGQDVFISASIGIATSPEDGQDSDALMKNAAIATDFAKQQGRGTYQFYSPDLDAKSRELFELETDLRRALSRNELELHYQPKVETSSGKTVGMEALVRWRHPSRGMISPGVFIPMAEDGGLIVPIGAWLLEEACRENMRLAEAGFDNLKVSVNISAVQISDPGLHDVVANALANTGLDPARLILEITESVVMGDVESNLKVLHDIRGLGVSLSIDDFGTGYSSLSYLKRFPIEELKVDKSFLDEVEHSDEDAAIVRAIIVLAHTLELTVTAEGVENANQVAFLQEVGCDIIQGYHFSKPLPPDQLLAFLQG
ncbi:MAG: EAL domain-containing protein [Pseudomonadales bacterium]|nr:EAL domain-containing protein [Pseudomonadales bacterium]